MRFILYEYVSVYTTISNNYFKIWYDVEYQGDILDSMSEGKKAFVIVGFSYWEVDQEEFNWFLDNLPVFKLWR